jgi:hypothetical protein
MGFRSWAIGDNRYLIGVDDVRSSSGARIRMAEREGVTLLRLMAILATEAAKKRRNASNPALGMLFSG